MLLRQRSIRLRRFHRAAVARQRAWAFDSGRIRLAVFTLWRWWARSQALGEAAAVEAAQRSGLHVQGAAAQDPWWEAGDG